MIAEQGGPRKPKPAAPRPRSGPSGATSGCQTPKPSEVTITFDWPSRRKEDKADHIAWAAEAIAIYQRHCRTGDEHAIADLICDLGHLAEERGFDFISEVRRGIGHWYAELHAEDRNDLGPDAAVEITINPR